MTCENCDPKYNYSGRLIKVDKDLIHCALCGERIKTCVGLKVHYNEPPESVWNSALQAAVLAAQKGATNWIVSSVPGGFKDLCKAIEAEIVNLKK